MMFYQDDSPRWSSSRMTECFPTYSLKHPENSYYFRL